MPLINDYEIIFILFIRNFEIFLKLNGTINPTLREQIYKSLFSYTVKCISKYLPAGESEVNKVHIIQSFLKDHPQFEPMFAADANQVLLSFLTIAAGELVQNNFFKLICKNETISQQTEPSSSASLPFNEFDLALHCAEFPLLAYVTKGMALQRIQVDPNQHTLQSGTNPLTSSSPQLPRGSLTPLADDIADEIFQYLSFSDIKNMRMVSSEFADMSYLEMVRRHYPDPRMFKSYFSYGLQSDVIPYHRSSLFTSPHPRTLVPQSFRKRLDIGCPEVHNYLVGHLGHTPRIASQIIENGFEYDLNPDEILEFDSYQQSSQRFFPSICTAGGAFAAVFNNKQLMCGGVLPLSERTNPILPPDTHVDRIYSTQSAFAAILNNGALICWGDILNGGRTPILPPGTHAVRIYFTRGAFAAILNNGDLICWGDPNSGGRTPILPPGTHAVRIYSTSHAFAAVLNNGNVICWGAITMGGTTPTLPDGTHVVRIYSSYGAFAAILNNGELIYWGVNSAHGHTTITPTLPNGTHAVRIYSTDFEFGVHLDNGEFVIRRIHSQEYVKAVLPRNTYITRIYASKNNFFCLLNTGKVIASSGEDPGRPLSLPPDVSINRLVCRSVMQNHFIAFFLKDCSFIVLNENTIKRERLKFSSPSFLYSTLSCASRNLSVVRLYSSETVDHAIAVLNNGNIININLNFWHSSVSMPLLPSCNQLSPVFVQHKNPELEKWFLEGLEMFLKKHQNSFSRHLETLTEPNHPHISFSLSSSSSSSAAYSSSSASSYPIISRQSADWHRNTPNCEVCNAKFHLPFFRPHHCRKCGSCICDICSLKNHNISDIRNNRICKPCAQSVGIATVI